MWFMEKDLSSIRTGKRVGSRWSSLRFSSYYGTYLLDPQAKQALMREWTIEKGLLVYISSLSLTNGAPLKEGPYFT